MGTKIPKKLYECAAGSLYYLCCPLFLPNGIQYQAQLGLCCNTRCICLEGYYDKDSPDACVQIAVLVMLILEAVTGQGALGNWLKL